MIFDLLHLAGGVVVCGHAAALLPDLNGSGLQEAVPDWPLGHVSSAVAADLYLDVSRTGQVKRSQSDSRLGEATRLTFHSIRCGEAVGDECVSPSGRASPNREVPMRCSSKPQGALLMLLGLPGPLLLPVPARLW